MGFIFTHIGPLVAHRGNAGLQSGVKAFIDLLGQPPGQSCLQLSVGGNRTKHCHGDGMRRLEWTEVTGDGVKCEVGLIIHSAETRRSRSLSWTVMI